jgi:limonene-1,2-epoxide hydrolase
VFIAEIDTVVEQSGGRRTTMSLVQIFRVRCGRIVLLRDYFTAPPLQERPGVPS